MYKLKDTLYIFVYTYICIDVYVVSYLISIGATVISETLSGEYITANAPIRLWEAMFHTKNAPYKECSIQRMFHTKFFMFHKTSDAIVKRNL
jgi:hypothetical protein